MFTWDLTPSRCMLAEEGKGDKRGVFTWDPTPSSSMLAEEGKGDRRVVFTWDPTPSSYADMGGGVPGHKHSLFAQPCNSCRYDVFEPVSLHNLLFCAGIHHQHTPWFQHTVRLLHKPLHTTILLSVGQLDVVQNLSRRPGGCMGGGGGGGGGGGVFVDACGEAC